MRDNEQEARGFFAGVSNPVKIAARDEGAVPFFQLQNVLLALGTDDANLTPARNNVVDLIRIGVNMSVPYVAAAHDQILKR